MRNGGWREAGCLGVGRVSGCWADGPGATAQAWPQCLAPPGRPPSWLLLVLALGGRVEVIQHTLDIFEGGPLLGAVLPAASHDVVELLGAVLWSRHPVPPLQCPDHLGV